MEFLKSYIKKFTFLDWMIHFGILSNLLVSLYIVWFVIMRKS